MRLAPFADSAAVQWRRCWQRYALFTDWLPADLADALWQHPERLLNGATVLQHRGVRRTVRIHWAGTSFVLKHFVEPTWRHGLKQLVSRSRARTTWNMMHLLADAGVLTPRPLACVENTSGPFRLDSYLLYAYVPGETIRQHLSAQPDPLQTATALKRQLATLWDRLKALQVSLADANPGNFIVSSDHQLWVIDLDKARRHRSAFFGEIRRQSTWQRLTSKLAQAAHGGVALPSCAPLGQAA